MPSQFATLDDARVAYGDDTALLAFKRDAAEDLNSPSLIARADLNFQRASAKILSLIGGAYTIPDTPPEDTATFLLSCAVDIGIYLAVPRTGEFLQEWKDRAMKCLEMLEDIGNGDADLPGLDPDPNSAGPQVDAPDRRFFYPASGSNDYSGVV